MVGGLRERIELFITFSRFFSSLDVCQLASCPFLPDYVIMSSEPDPDIMLPSK